MFTPDVLFLDSDFSDCEDGPDLVKLFSVYDSDFDIEYVFFHSFPRSLLKPLPVFGSTRPQPCSNRANPAPVTHTLRPPSDPTPATQALWLPSEPAPGVQALESPAEPVLAAHILWLLSEPDKVRNLNRWCADPTSADLDKL